METARDTYSRIDPDSPWRWVPILVFTVLIVPVEIAIRADLGGRDRALLWAAALALVALAVIAWLRLGSGTPLDDANARARECEGVRIAEYPGLARALVALGIGMFVTWAAVLTLVWRVHSPRPALEMIVCSLSFPVIAMLLIQHGRERPWDLKVVERVKTASE